ncbi:MAG: class I adenylate-forming enzyme family protein [Novosphingobium sp.]
MRREIHHGRIVRCFADRPANVDMLLQSAVNRRPEGMALRADDLSLSYRDLDKTVEQVARNLAARGLKKGDRIALLLGNLPEFLIVFLAAARLGAIVLPLNVRQRRPEILFMLEHSQAAILVYEDRMADELPGQDELPGLRHRIVVGKVHDGAEPFDNLRTEAPPFATVIVDEDDPVCILYTSGTTGTPKGATLTHFGVIHSAIHFETGLGLHEGEIGALAVPASHVTGLIAILLAMLRVAGTSVLMKEFKAREFLRLVEEERVTYSLMVPAMYNLCLLAPEATERDLSSWRVGGFGGAPMPPATITRLAELIPQLQLMNVYGATETTSPATILPSSAIATHADSVGQSVACADIVVVDPDGREVPHGQMGELLIAGPMTIPYYWNNPEANATSFVGGYWRSGDIGSVDEDGFVRIHDRLKDVVNRGGYKIYSIEVEAVIARLPDVSEVAVVGYPDPVLGERVAAFVHCPAGAPPGEQIREHCARNLSDYKVPDTVMALDTPLPRNANGKVLKNALRDIVAEHGGHARKGA